MELIGNQRYPLQWKMLPEFSFNKKTILLDFSVLWNYPIFERKTVQNSFINMLKSINVKKLEENGKRKPFSRSSLGPGCFHSGMWMVVLYRVLSHLWSRRGITIIGIGVITAVTQDIVTLLLGHPVGVLETQHIKLHETHGLRSMKLNVIYSACMISEETLSAL